MSVGPDTLDAGTVELGVESDTTGFGKKLQQKLDKETKDVAAKVGIDLRKKTGALKKELQAKVDQVAVGVAATIGIDVSQDNLRLELQNAAQQAALGIVAEIGVRLNHKGLRAELETVAAEASEGVSAVVAVDVDESKHEKFRDKLRNFLGRAAKDNDARVGVTIDQTDAANAANETADTIEKTIKKRNIWSRIFQRRPGATGTEDDPDGSGATPGMPEGPGLTAPGGGKKPKKIGMFLDGISGGVTKFLLMLSLVQPAIAAIAAGGGALLTMAANLSTSVATLAAVPLLLSGLVLAVGTGILAFSGLTGELKDMPPAMREARRGFESLKGEWTALRDEVRQNFWKEWSDQIKPIGEVFLPQLQKGLGLIATNLGGGALDLAKWLGGEKFKNDFASITEALAGKDGKSGFLGNIRKGLFGVEGQTDATGDATHGLMGFFSDLMVATIPLQEEFGVLIERFGAWAGGLLNTEGERDRFKKFLDYASDKGAQASRIVGDMASALAGIFRAGQGTGDSLLDKFEKAVSNFDDWVNGPGYAKIQDFFKAIEPAAGALGTLFVELAKGLGELMANEQVAGLIEELATDLLPSLVDMLKGLGETMGPQVIDAVGQFVELLTKFGDNGTVIGVAAGAVGMILDDINAFLDAHPDAATTVGGIVAALMGLSALKQLGGGGGLFSGLFGDVVAGAAAGAGGKGGGVGENIKNRVLGLQQVYWNKAMPVYITNPGALGGGDDGDTYVDGDGKDKDKNGKPKGKPGTTTGGGSNTYVDVPDGDRNSKSKGGKSKPKGKFGWLSSLFGGGDDVADAAGKAGKGGFFSKLGGAAKGGLKGGGLLGILAGVTTGLAGGAIQDGNGGFRDGGGGALAGAGTGAGIGAMVGSVVPGVGTAIGAGVGGVIGGAAGFATSVDWDTVGQEWSDGWAGFTGNVSTGWEGFKTSSGLLWDALKTTTNEKWGEIALGVVTKAQDVVAGASEKWEAVKTTASVAWDNVKTTASEKWQGLKEGVVTKAAEIVTGASEKWEAVKTTAGVAWDNVKTTASEKWGDLKTGVVTKAAEIVTGASEKWDSVKTTAGAAWDSVKTTAGAKWGELKSNVTTAAQGIAGNVGDKLGTAKEKASTAWNNVKTDASAKWQDIKSTVGTGVGNALVKVGEFGADAKSKLSGVSLSSAGSSIGRSLVDGLSSMKSSIISTARSMGQWIKDNKGPIEYDRIMLRDEGVAIVQGLLKAMESQYPEAVASLRGFTAELAGTDTTWTGTADLSASLSPSSTMANLLSQSAADGANDPALEQAGTYETDGASSRGITFMPGSVLIHNPIAETASESISAVLRETSYFEN